MDISLVCVPVVVILSVWGIWGSIQIMIRGEYEVKIRELSGTKKIRLVGDSAALYGFVHLWFPLF